MAAALTLLQAAPGQDTEVERFAALLGELTARAEVPAQRLEAMVSSFVTLSNDGALSRLPEPELEAMLADLRELTADLAPSWHAYLEFYVAWAWVGRGRHDRAAETLLAVRRRLPRENFERQRRGELLADVHRVLGQPMKALEELRALERTCAPDDTAGRAAIHGIRAEVYSENGLLDEAARELELAGQLARASKDDQALETTLLRQIEFDLSTDRFARVLEGTSELLAGAHAPVQAMALVYRGVAECGIERTVRTSSRARGTLLAALEHEALTPSLRLQVRLKLFEIALRDGQLDEAARQRDACGRLLPRPETGARVTPWRHATYRALCARFAVVAGGSIGELEAALMELRRSYRALLSDWEAIGARKGGIGFLHLDDRRLVLGELIDLQLELAKRQRRDDGPADALATLLAAHAMNSIARARGARACTVDDVRGSLLRPGRGMMVYLPWRRLTHLFVVDRSRVQCLRLPPHAQLMRDVQRFTEFLAHHPTEAKELPGMAERLCVMSDRCRRALVPVEVEKQLTEWQGVTVVGSELIGHVPFSALRLGTGRLLGEALAVDNLSSLALGVTLRREHRTHSGGSPRLTLLACTRTTADAARAKGIEPTDFPREGAVERVLAAYGGEENRALIDRQLTVDAMQALDLTASQVTHIIAHSVRDLAVELGAGLALHDGVFWHEDLLRQDVRGLFVLSSCASGHSPSRSGDSALATNLGGALLRHGAHTVVQALAPIELYGHLRMMEIFHRELAAGRSTAKALQIARRELAGDDWVARFYRAQIQVHGLGQYPLH